MMTVELADQPIFTPKVFVDFDAPVVVRRPVPELSREEFTQALTDLQNFGFIQIIQQDEDFAMVQKRKRRS